jgi:hypothetical protein
MLRTGVTVHFVREAHAIPGGFRRFPQPFSENTATVPQFRLPPLPSKSFAMHQSSIIMYATLCNLASHGRRTATSVSPVATQTRPHVT